LLFISIIIFLNPPKNKGRKKIEKVRKNGEANAPGGRPTQQLLCNKTD